MDDPGSNSTTMSAAALVFHASAHSDGRVEAFSSAE